MCFSIVLIIILLWLFSEVFIRLIAQKGLAADFYGSISENEVQESQDRNGIKISRGNGWIHLGWVADTKREIYKVEIQNGENWETLAIEKFGSHLYHGSGGEFRIVKINKQSHAHQLMGIVNVITSFETHDNFRPFINNGWHLLYKPEINGDYVNDHTIYQDKSGKWVIMGITSTGQGDYRNEKYFTSATSDEMPPNNMMVEDERIAEIGKLAWAPHVILHDDQFNLFWSPYQLHRLTSNDGRNWSNYELVIKKPFHKFFRDAFIYKISGDQFLLYATSKGFFFSRIDLYQSFDLLHWQYIRPAIKSLWGSERNFVSGSMESPKLIKYRDGYYLSTTYNNGSTFLSALLLQLHIFLNKKSYNDTMVFHSSNPYDFGTYHGRNRSNNLVARLSAHAPNYLNLDGKWYITTCGWPFASTLTSGEVAITRMDWEKIPHKDQKT